MYSSLFHKLIHLFRQIHTFAFYYYIDSGHTHTVMMRIVVVFKPFSKSWRNWIELIYVTLEVICMKRKKKKNHDVIFDRNTFKRMNNRFMIFRFCLNATKHKIFSRFSIEMINAIIIKNCLNGTQLLLHSL